MIMYETMSGTMTTILDIAIKTCWMHFVHFFLYFYITNLVYSIQNKRQLWVQSYRSRQGWLGWGVRRGGKETELSSLTRSQIIINHVLIPEPSSVAMMNEAKRRKN